MKYRVRHKTTYHYSEPVSLCHNTLHLKPRSTPQQNCIESEIEVDPFPQALNEYTDYFGNSVCYFALQERHHRLVVSAASEVDVQPFVPPMPGFTPPWEDVRERLSGPEAQVHLEAVQFLHESEHIRFSDDIAEFAAPSFTPRRPILEAALDLTARINQEFKYDSSATTLTTALDEVLQIRKGVCQDFAHLEIACLRMLGLAARYHSGYLLTVPPPGQERLVGADASHAWVSIFVPEFGWIDLDPTNNVVPSDKHVLVGWGRDYADVSPLKGVILGGGKHSMSVSVDVMPC